MHLRRFLWRPDGLGGNHPWRIAVPTSVNFGETAAPTIATKVKNRAAEDYKHISEDVSKMIIRDCIMDDINIKATDPELFFGRFRLKKIDSDFLKRFLFP